ncbi:MAG: hypothetical protein ACI9MR_004065, partial [Myxococcota bacterium]
MATFKETETPDVDLGWRDRDETGLPPGPRAAMVALIGVVVACAIPYAVIAAVGEPYPDDVVMGV